VDLDTVTTQGFWICALVGGVTLAVAFLAGNPVRSPDLGEVKLIRV
jgi:hypothetical protein